MFIGSRSRKAGLSSISWLRSGPPGAALRADGSTTECSAFMLVVGRCAARKGRLLRPEREEIQPSEGRAFENYLQPAGKLPGMGRQRFTARIARQDHPLGQAVHPQHIAAMCAALT